MSPIVFFFCGALSTCPMASQWSLGFEWRTGFPYTVFTAGYQVIGERNRGGRFPNFFSADLAVTKGLTVKGKFFSSRLSNF